MHLALVVLIGLLLTPSAIARGVPTFGLPSDSVASEGFGEVRPARIFLGGDISGLVTGARWHRWGAPKAIGHGRGWYIPPGAITADGHKARARLVAWDLGNCGGQLAYRKGEWYFPEYHRRGQYPEGTYFSRRFAINLCDG